MKCTHFRDILVRDAKVSCPLEPYIDQTSNKPLKWSTRLLSGKAIELLDTWYLLPLLYRH